MAFSRGVGVRVLWLDDEKYPAIEAALDDAGFIVDRAYLLSDAERLLEKHAYRIILLDTLLPVYPEDIAIGYSRERMDCGNTAGLAFYDRHKEQFEDMYALVFVYSVLGADDEVVQEFVNAGVPEEHVLYKVSECNVSSLLTRLRRALDGSGR